MWEGFVLGNWNNSIDVRDFIDKNYKEYLGDSNFLVGPTDASKKLNEMFSGFLKEEKTKLANNCFHCSHVATKLLTYNFNWMISNFSVYCN